MIRQYDLWLANLNPAKGTEPGKTRPVVIIQTDELNAEHPSVIICPMTTNVHSDSEILRVHLKKAQLDKTSDIMVDQIRSINKRRLIQKLGKLSPLQVQKLKRNLRIVLDLD